MMGCIPGWRTLLLGICCIGPVSPVPMLFAQQSTEFQMEFTDLQLIPSHWLLKLNPDGSGSFDAESSAQAQADSKQIFVGDLHRTIQLSPAFTERIFAIAHSHRLFTFPCESHLKVAFQGTKRFSYSGPDGTGSCEFNYSKDKEIEALKTDLLAVETTIMSGARMEKLLQHDRLGLDEELESLTASAHDGNALEMGTIRDTLTRIVSDEQVMDRARRKARLLLAQAH